MESRRILSGRVKEWECIISVSSLWSRANSKTLQQAGQNTFWHECLHLVKLEMVTHYLLVVVAVPGATPHRLAAPFAILKSCSAASADDASILRRPFSDATGVFTLGATPVKRFIPPLGSGDFTLPHRRLSRF